VIVPPAVYGRYRETLRDQPLVAVAGRVQRGTGILNVLAERAVSLDLGAPDAQPGEARAPSVVGAPVASRDFR
jgi:hypothetical protein